MKFKFLRIQAKRSGSSADYLPLVIAIDKIVSIETVVDGTLISTLGEGIFHTKSNMDFILNEIEVEDHRNS
jgi:hypothetical protein